jgi:LysR family transcriptional regulator, hydrogen peroxide-inducible genes activator
VIAQPLESDDASRRVSLVYRRSFPRYAALKAFADIILENLPNTVKRLGPAAQVRKNTSAN